MKMALVLILFQFLTIISSVYSILVGLKSFRYLKLNRVLILLPIFSLLQVLLSETVFYTKNGEHGKSNYSTEFPEQINVLIYTLLEYCIISYFLIMIQNKKIIKNIIIIFSLITLSVLFFDLRNYILENNIITLDAFYSAEGVFFIVSLLFTIINQIRKNSISELINNSEWIICIGILLAFLILWPNSVIQKFFILNVKDFYNYFFITNSIAYLIMFNLISLSFHVARKSRNN